MSYWKARDVYKRQAYNSEIRGFYNYYCIANNVAYALSKFGYIMEYSMYPVSYTHLAKGTGENKKTIST